MDLETKLELFGSLTLICGILAIFFLLLSVLLFWKLGVKQAFLERTGIAKKKSITQMQELNALSGRMTKSSAAKVAEQEFTGGLTGDRKKSRGKKTGDIRGLQRQPAVENQAPGTSVLSPEMDETSVLSGQLTMSPEWNSGQSTAQTTSQNVAGGRFDIILNQQFIHTNEYI